MQQNSLKDDLKLYRKVKVVLTRLPDSSQQSKQISTQENSVPPDTERLQKRNSIQFDGENENHKDVRFDKC